MIENCQMMKPSFPEREARFITNTKNIGRDNKIDCFLYSCCWHVFGQEGCRKFKHCSGVGNDDDEIFL